MVDLDQSLAVDASDLALVAARANAAGSELANPNFSPAIGAPAGLTAPSAVVLGAAFFIQKVSTVGTLTGTLQVTLSGAGSLTLLLQVVPTATNISGGTAVDLWRMEDGVTPVVVTGSSPATIATLTKTLPAGGLTDIIPFAIPIGAQVKNVNAYQILVTSSQDLSAMVLSAMLIEIV